MSFLITEDEVMVVNSDDIKFGQKIPLGFWKMDAAQFKGIFLKKTEFKLSHGKIYGKSQSIANHIVEAFENNPSNKNLGVLFSGGRGLGKTLTTRLVIEQLSKKYPIIIISEYFNGMVDFLENLKDCVILMDEFEKFMSGNIRGNEAEDEQTKQETLLSLLDGNTGSVGNLFLLTVNNTYKLDDNLKSRPGRIRYHYRYTSESPDVVREYCRDNLNDQSLTEDIIKVLSCAVFVSMDILTAFVDELNKFPGMKPKDVAEYFNIESNSSCYKYIVTCRDRVDGNVYHFERTCDTVDYDGMGLVTKDRVKYKELYGKEGNDLDYYDMICTSIDNDEIPSYMYGREQIDPESLTVHYVRTIGGEQQSFEDSDLEIVSVTVEDPDMRARGRKYLGKDVSKDDFLDV